MAFKDLETLLYDGTVKLTYMDKAHRYDVSFLKDGEWTKPYRPASVTGAKDATLEKAGLQMWPLGLALKHLFGYYNFTNDKGEKMIGFSNDVGVMWGIDLANGVDKTVITQHCTDAYLASTKEKQKGADIGSMVHDAVEQYINGTPFEITVERYGQGLVHEDEKAKAAWEEKAPGEVEMANVAFSAFKAYWDKLGATVEMAEQIVYSKELDLAGTFDYLLNIPGKGRVLADLKTTNASVRGGAPQGVYYDFMIQLGMYASVLTEMGYETPDDLLIISARKDGGFNAVYASDIGLTVEECMDWGDAVATCYQLMKRTKKALKTFAGGSESEEE